MAVSFVCLVTAVVCCSGLVHAYNVGAPYSACDTMVPAHGVSPSREHPGYRFAHDMCQGYQAGRLHNIDVRGPAFKGFFCRVQKKGTVDARNAMGRWDSRYYGRYTRSSSCSVPQTGVTNLNSDGVDPRRTHLRFKWRAPTNDEGILQITCSIVRNRTVFFVALRGGDIHFKNTSAAPVPCPVSYTDAGPPVNGNRCHLSCPAGPAGEKGARGATGPPGDAAQKGEAGRPGARGHQGPRGISVKGARGPPGANGTPGGRGSHGQKGDVGRLGSTGSRGPKGDMGRPGARGPQGPKAERGYPGPAGPAGTPADMTGTSTEELENEMRWMKEQMRLLWKTIARLNRAAAINCGDPGAITNGQRTVSGYSSGDTATYQCKKRYTRNGPEASTCQASGQWAPPPPSCDADCFVSQWSAWQACSRNCGHGQTVRNRVVLRAPQGIGNLCPVLRETRSCHLRPCVSCDGLLEGEAIYRSRTLDQNVAADVIIVMDESAGMESMHASMQFFVHNLETGLVDQRYGISPERPNKYALIGYGQHGSRPSNMYPHAYSNDQGDTLFRADDIGAVASQLFADGNGYLVDGYSAIKYALENLPLRGSADPLVASNIILITDGDRDTLPGAENLTRAAMARLIPDYGARLNVVVDQQFECGSRRAVGVVADMLGYVADASGFGHTVCSGSRLSESHGTTSRDYTTLALELHGAAWDISMLRAGGASASIVTSAFIAANAPEIITQDVICRECTCIDDGGWGRFICRVVGPGDLDRCKCKAESRDNQYVNGHCTTVA